jgi:general secretion pathway protein J
MLKQVKQKGFTLIEILVALAIFAIIGIAAATCLHQMIRYRTHLTAQADQWRELAIARLLIQKDFSNAIYLSDKDFGAALLPKFSGQSQQVTLTRWNHQQASWVKNAPLFAGISYSVSNKNLLRTVKDTLGHSIKSVVAQHIQSVQFKYLDASGNWGDQWNAINADTVQVNKISLLPLAIRVILKVKGVGTVQWDLSKPVVSG